MIFFFFFLYLQAHCLVHCWHCHRRRCIGRCSDAYNVALACTLPCALWRHHGHHRGFVVTPCALPRSLLHEHVPCYAPGYTGLCTAVYAVVSAAHCHERCLRCGNGMHSADVTNGACHVDSTMVVTHAVPRRHGACVVPIAPWQWHTQCQLYYGGGLRCADCAEAIACAMLTTVVT